MPECVPRMAQRSQEHSGMLNSPVWIEQLGADHADFGPLGMLDQRVELPWIDNLDIVVQEQQKLSFGCLGASIVEV